MRRWVALAVIGLGVSWGPYLYGLGARPHATEISPLTAADDQSPLTAAEGESPPSAASDDAPAKPLANPPLMAARAIPVAPTAVVAAAPAASALPAAVGEPNLASEARPVTGIANPSADLLPAFRHAFEREPRDSFWASDEEPHLSQLMQAAGVPDGTVSEVTCRRSVCRVSFNKADLGSEAESKMLASLHQEFGSSVSIESNDPDNSAHAPLYVLRSGYNLDPAP
jgi:hypothetical protein